MGFLDKAKAAAEEATAKAKEGVEDVQLKRELSQAYNELGKTAFDLVESNELTHPKLEEVAAKIRTLNERDKGGDAAATGTGRNARSEPAARHAHLATSSGIRSRGFRHARRPLKPAACAAGEG